MLLAACRRRSWGRDPGVLLVRLAKGGAVDRRLKTVVELEIVAGASHLFEEPGALERVADLASAWFVRHLAGGGS